MIGYCPQFDSIVDVMTGREMLSLFAHIRGVPAAKRREEVGKWLDFVGLRQYADRRCGTYSGGNKRKLNVAQALVGDPVSAWLNTLVYWGGVYAYFFLKKNNRLNCGYFPLSDKFLSRKKVDYMAHRK